jgi:hypothetical protein
MKQIGPITLLWLLLIAYGLGGARAASVAEPAGDEIAASPGAPRYDIGTPTLADLWVDPANGGDGNSGATREQALRSITEAWNRAVDFVAVQHGHIVGNRVHNAQDWCMYQKGGSAYFRVEGNEFYDCGTGGFTAGQGTGFQFMTAPWLHYEAYDIKVVNNLIHDTAGAGLGVNGGYNILLAYNTLYRVGVRDHVLEIVHGRRGCDGGDAAHCQPLIDAGGWGLTGDEAQFIPNRNVYVYNNIIYNPAGYQSSQQFDIRGPVTPPPRQQCAQSRVCRRWRAHSRQPGLERAGRAAAGDRRSVAGLSGRQPDLQCRPAPGRQCDQHPRAAACQPALWRFPPACRRQCVRRRRADLRATDLRGRRPADHAAGSTRHAGECRRNRSRRGDACYAQPARRVHRRSDGGGWLPVSSADCVDVRVKRGGLGTFQRYVTIGAETALSGAAVKRTCFRLNHASGR